MWNRKLVCIPSYTASETMSESVSNQYSGDTQKFAYSLISIFRTWQNCDRVKVVPGDILHFCTWGSGGWGDPFTRPPEKALEEVEDGLATIERARRYGVVILEADGDFNIDASAAGAPREKMIEERSDDISLFDKEDVLSELITRCENDTRLAEPSPSVFPSWMQRDLAAEYIRNHQPDKIGLTEE